MALAVTSRIVSDTVIVDVSGRLCFLEFGLREHINELLEKGQRNFVLNLAEVPYVDSFGLGQLITVWNSIRAHDGQMVLLRPTDRVQKLFEITKLNSIFHTSSDDAQALATAGIPAKITTCVSL
jgi:anti-anti-sigma factor